MSIFVIIFLCLLLAATIGLIAFGITHTIEEEADWKGRDFSQRWYLITLAIFIVVWVGSVFIGIGLDTESERVYVQEYVAKKETIESSLSNEDLSGLEKIQLVQQATELNGEFAHRKAVYNLWHTVYYDTTIYDGVKPINLK